MSKLLTNYRFPVFVAAAVVQIWVLGKMIIDREITIRDGVTVKIPCRLYDPHDPFRGRYVALRPQPGPAEVIDRENIDHSKPVYLVLDIGDDGVGKSRYVSSTKPIEGIFIEYREKWRFRKDRAEPRFPISRFYLNEKKAPQVERRIRELQQNRDTCHLVLKVLQGAAVPVDIEVNDESVN